MKDGFLQHRIKLIQKSQ